VDKGVTRDARHYISHAFPPHHLSVISTATNEVVDTIDSTDSPAVAAGTWGLAITPDGALGRGLRLCGNSSALGRGAVGVISTLVDVIETGPRPWGVAITPAAEGARAWAKVQLCHRGHVIQVAEPAVHAHLKRMEIPFPRASEHGGTSLRGTSMAKSSPLTRAGFMPDDPSGPSRDHPSAVRRPRS
jgi:hypothetical protein